VSNFFQLGCDEFYHDQYSSNGVCCGISFKYMHSILKILVADNTASKLKHGYIIPMFRTRLKLNKEKDAFKI